jgi:nicotinamide mononucleotide (NMN) deamidase PncC
MDKNKKSKLAEAFISEFLKDEGHKIAFCESEDGLDIYFHNKKTISDFFINRIIAISNQFKTRYKFNVEFSDTIKVSLYV